jgi:hypothetical protein
MATEAADKDKDKDKKESPAPRGRAGRARAWWGRRSWRAKARFVMYPALVGIVVGFLCWTLWMPGSSYEGPQPALDSEGQARAILLERDVVLLSETERNTSTRKSLDRAAQMIESELKTQGYAPKSLPYVVDGTTVANIEVTIEGSGQPNEIVVIGAHYDSAQNAPGADDNASGVAAMLAIARAFDKKPRRRTVRFVAFVNEEPPHFWNESMGSLRYAKACKERGDVITAMLSLESLGYYRDEPGSQKYPPIVSWFFPDRANFIAFVGNLGSRSLVHESIGAFRASAKFPSEGAAMPSFVAGVGWSDQWSFWQVGYPGVMVTDTAPYRNPNYHTKDDKPATLDYARLSVVTAGLIAVVEKLAQ